MTNISHIAAIIAASLAVNDRYKKCISKGNYSSFDGLGERDVYALDVDAIVKDAMAIAIKIDEADRLRDPNTLDGSEESVNWDRGRL